MITFLVMMGLSDKTIIGKWLRLPKNHTLQIPHYDAIDHVEVDSQTSEECKGARGLRYLKDISTLYH